MLRTSLVLVVVLVVAYTEGAILKKHSRRGDSTPETPISYERRNYCRNLVHPADQCPVEEWPQLAPIFGPTDSTPSSNLSLSGRLDGRLYAIKLTSCSIVPRISSRTVSGNVTTSSAKRSEKKRSLKWWSLHTRFNRRYASLSLEILKLVWTASQTTIWLSQPHTASSASKIARLVWIRPALSHACRLRWRSSLTIATKTLSNFLQRRFALQPKLQAHTWKVWDFPGTWGNLSSTSKSLPATLLNVRGRCWAMLD